MTLKGINRELFVVQARIVVKNQMFIGDIREVRGTLGVVQFMSEVILKHFRVKQRSYVGIGTKLILLSSVGYLIFEEIKLCVT